MERLRLENALRKKIPCRMAGTAARSAQYRAIYHHKEEYAVRAKCEFFGVSRAAYYAWGKKLAEPDPDQERMDQIQTVCEASHKSYGYRRITIPLQRKQGLRINRKAVLRRMGKLELGIRSQARRLKMYQKLEEIGTYHRYPNILHRDFVATKPNQKWVTDVTYIRTVQGWAYLSTIKDLYGGFIVAHVFDPSNSIALVTQTKKKRNKRKRSAMDLSSTVTRAQMHVSGISWPYG